MLGAMNQKILRDIWNIKGQMLAIILVMMAGIAVFVITFGVLDSLRLTQNTYYDRYQFADVFASLKRAPESVKQRINDIHGVSLVETRVVFGVTLQMSDLLEPASGKIISLPDSHRPLLNNLYLRSGRFLYPNESNAILADEAFFNAHKLALGDKIAVIMNGHKRQLKIVGVVLSPEYVYSIAPGSLMPDNKRYGVFWMSRRSLEAAVNMKGAFNDVALKIEREANIENIKDDVDLILKPYGGLMAYGRDEQISNFFVNNELKQLESLGFVAPIIFLSVAAFLINVVMSRQIATQRVQIGMLKAVGYNETEIAFHYLKMVLLIVFLGSLLGLSLGSWMGSGMTQMYTEFFHFPILQYSFSPEIMIFAVLFCTLAAVLGTLFSIRKASQLPPAEAMSPEAPTSYKHSLLDRLGAYQHLSFLSKMILRQLERRPFRALLSALGMALSLSILIFSFFMKDSMNFLMEIQYDQIQREDVNLAFIEPVAYSALDDIKALPGVMSVEPLRNVPVELSFEHYKKRSNITGLPKSADLRRIINEQLQAVNVPDFGLVLSKQLATILHVNKGDVIQVEVLDGKRMKVDIPIVEVIQEFMGMGAFMHIRELNRLLDEPPKVTGASLMVDDHYSVALYKKLKQIPMIIGLNITSILRQIFESIMAENMMMMVSSNVIFAIIISFGVIYNTARIALSERGRELASLRVLGLTRKEVATILFGELGVITILSIPLGIWIGYYFVLGMVASLDSELFRVPAQINLDTFAYAVSLVLLCAMVSFYLVWRQIDQIDLVSAQKGVE